MSQPRNLPGAGTTASKVRRSASAAPPRLAGEGQRWGDWTRGLWRLAEGRWLARDGQDHYYRDQVVLPGIRQAVDESGVRFRSLSDLGAGDSYSTCLLALGLVEKGLESVLLVDRSEKLLTAAPYDRMGVPVRRVIGDLTRTEDWATALRNEAAPRLVTSVFVLQELPGLRGFFEGLHEALGPDDLALFVIVNPSYSALLRDRGDIRGIEVASAEVDDWQWAGEYPISVPDDVLYLPHFQRSHQIFARAIGNAGLRLKNWKELAVPPTEDARRIFGATVYGEEILRVSSSVLFSVAA